MATQPNTPEIEAGLDSARSALAAALAGKPAGSPPVAAGSTPPPEPVPAVVPAPATPPAIPPVQPGISGTMPAGLLPTPPSPAAPAGIPPAPGTQPVPPQFTDPAARRFLEMHQGNMEAALAKALRDNNRLAALARTNPDLFKPGAPADPSVPVVPEVAQLFVDPATVAPGTTPVSPVAPEVPINWAQIAAETDKRATEVDEVCRGYTQRWIDNEREIKRAATEVQAKQSRLGYLDSLLKDSSVELPELRAEEFKDERRTLLSEVSTLRQDAMLRIMANDRLDQLFRERRSQIYDEVARGYRTAATEQAFTAELQQIEATEYQRISSSWPGAVARTVASTGIPQDLKPDFENYAKQMVNAALADPSFELADVDSFLTAVAKGYFERLDRYHRAQAAQYGQLAVSRAASPSPSVAPGTPAPVVTPPSMLTPEEAIEGANRYLRERLRGA